MNSNFSLDASNGDYSSFFSEDFFDSEEMRELEESLTDNRKEPQAEVLIALCFQAFVVFVGIVANLLVIIITIVGQTRQESSSIIYVTNLSISNFVFLTSIPFKLHEDYFIVWKFGLALCQISIIIKFMNFTVLALFLMAMSVDRYLAVNKPLSSSHLRSRRAAVIASTTLWILALASALPLGLLHSSEEGPRCMPAFPGQKKVNWTEFMLTTNKTKDPVCKYSSQSVSFTVFTICNFLYSFFVPFIVIIICYCAIVHRVRNPLGVINNKGKHQRIVRRKVTQMAILLVISYSICYIPYYVWQLLQLVGVPVSNLNTCFHVQRFNNSMAYVNSAVQPLLYAFTSGQFSKQYVLVKRKLRRFLRLKNRQQTSVNSANTKRTTLRTNGSPSRDLPDQAQQPLVREFKGEGTPMKCTNL